MIKLTALNEVTNDESEHDFANTLTKEAQEQVALNEYNRALHLLSKNEKEEAMHVLIELLNTELLDEVQKPQIQDGRSRPMFFLKYSCFKNIASIKAELQNFHDAIYNYLEAANLDDSDVMLWFKIGTIAVKIFNLEIACLAFKQGLKRNHNHWPCLDNIITVLFAIPDYMNCLLYISMALEKDSTYIKGLAFRKKIFEDVPSLQECYKTYNSRWIRDPPLDTKFDQVIGNTLLNEAKELSKKWIELSHKQIKKKSLVNLPLRRFLSYHSWLELGKSLVDMYEYIVDNNLNIISPIVLNVSKNSDSNLVDNSKICNNESNKTKEVLVTTTYIKKETAVNSPLSKNDFDVLMEDNPNDVKISESNDENKSILNETLTVEEGNIKISTDKIYDRELADDSSNTFQAKEEKDNNSKKQEKIKIEGNKDKIYNADLEKLSHNFNDKIFENDEMNNKFDLKEKGQKVKKRRRSSLCFLTQWAWSSNNTKRTSRARNSTRKDYERDGIILEETLKRIFPSALLPDNTKFNAEEPLKNDDSIDAADLHYLMNKENIYTDDTKSMESSKPSSPSEDRLKYFGTEQECYDVITFLDEHSGESNIIIIIIKFIENICIKWNYEWPDKLSDMYIQLYLYMREHTPHTSPFIENVSNNISKLDTEITLLFCELYTDKWLASKPCALSVSSSNQLGIGISSDELGYIMFSKVRDNFEEENFYYVFRLLWLKANIFLYQGDVEVSLKTLELLLDQMQQLQLDVSKPFLKLTNCKYNSTVSIISVQKMLSSIVRSKKFCEIRRMYQEKRYEELSHILKDTFNFSKQLNPFILCKEVPIDRFEHLQILLDSLWQLQQYEDCFIWAEACLNEAWQNYLQNTNICASDNNRNKWTELVLYSLKKLDACVTEVTTFIVKHLPVSRQSRLVQNLVHIVCYQLDIIDNSLTMPIVSVLPWILLHTVLQYEEDKQRAKLASTSKYKSYISTYSESDDDDEDIPASITILLKGHEFLGRHHWCCIEEGRLLIFTLKLIIPKLHYPTYSSIKSKLKKPLEQIFYCLYGYPTKSIVSARSAPKSFDEHVKMHMILNWEAGELLFEFYKPENIPSFKSKRNDSINADTVTLFKKICTLFPQDCNPVFIKEEMDAYLLGKTNKIPCVKKSLQRKISYIYYLIADHYFKAASSQSWSNAIEYYTLDLCLHQNELNSWAGLAMSTGTIMEIWLNNFEPNINEEKYLTKAKIAQRSYQHAIDLAPSNLTIMTEYGNFLYTVHSFCSRLLKQESESLSMEKFRILETQKEEMLDKAKNCFVSAYNIYTSAQEDDEPQDERWLYQYMLAKISEKKNEDPPVFLKHYSKANQLLYENNAQYPRRISHSNPENLAIEALEVYYRIHASILKYLEQHEGKPLKKSLAYVMEQILKSCMQSPLMVYSSVFGDISRKQDNKVAETTQLSCNQSCSLKENETLMDIDRSNIQESVLDPKKCDNRKRYCDESASTNNIKKIKLSNVSHLQVMQDVVALIDDLINKVCDKVTDKQLEYKYQNSIFDTQTNNFSSNEMSVITEKNSGDTKDDRLKKKIKSGQENNLLILNNEDTKKLSRKCVQNEDFQTEDFQRSQQIEEKKKRIKLDESLCRRQSQESTTTTQTSTSETNNSSSSSSIDSSSSDDSSDSSSSTDSDSDSLESDYEKKKEITDDDENYASEEETKRLIEYCLAGLEQCVLRFPEHYKSIYRLAYFFFYSKISKNISKCKQLLLETYKCQFHPNQTMQGLFAERKNTNFFNGIWRIPINEIDRPGSFASHMSRCILLLMQVLKETEDSRMLTEMCLQLRKIPDTDKKYLRDSEREQLSCQALTLCLQCLRDKIKNWETRKNYNDHIDEKTQVLLDIFHTYKSLKCSQKYENGELSKVQKLLEDAYGLYIDKPIMQGNIFEQAKEFCKRLQENKINPLNNDSILSARTIESSTLKPDINISVPVASNASIITQTRKSQKMSVSGRPRGRPPGINKFPQMMNNDTILSQNQYKHHADNISGLINPAIKPYALNSLLEPNLLAMLGPSFNSNVIDSINYFNRVGAYQDIFRQCQNNLNSISNFNIPCNKRISGNIGNTQKANDSSIISNSNLNTTGEKSDISITPVTENVYQAKLKSSQLMSKNNVKDDYVIASKQLSNSLQISPSSNLSIFKQSHPNHPQQRISQPSNSQIPVTTNSSLPRSTVGVNRTSLPQTSNASITSVNHNNPLVNQSGTSLQHKLLSKKQRQCPRPLVSSINPLKKQGQCKVDSNPYDTSPMNVSVPYISLDANAITVSRIPSHSANIMSNSSKHTKTSTNLQKQVKSRSSSVQITPTLNPSASTSNTLTVLSQLQQHSHLEIIPQTNPVKHSDLANITGRSTIQINLPESGKFISTDSVSVYELPRRKFTSNFPTSQKKQEKSSKDNVEIITLDD